MEANVIRSWFRDQSLGCTLLLVLGMLTWAHPGWGSDTERGPAPELGMGQTAAPVCRLLEELRQRQLLPGTDEAAQRLAVESLMKSFGVGGSVIGPDDVSADGPLLDDIRPLNGRFSYLRVLSVGDGLEKLAAAALATLPEDREGGLVIDLRGTAGNGIEEASLVGATVGGCSLPIVVLIDGQTRSAAEVLAAQLREQCGGVLMGQSTRGLPYPLHPVVLAADLQVMLPAVPAGEERSPVEPDVYIDQAHSFGVTAPIPQPQPAMVDLAGDESVRKALDLLTAISTFRQKHF